MNQRLARLRAHMREREFEAVLISSAANRRYISGFTGSDGTLLVTDSVALIFTDFRYQTQAAHEAPTFEQRQITSDSPLPTLLASAVADLGLTRVVFEGNRVSVARYNRMYKAFESRFGTATGGSAAQCVPVLEPVEDIVETLREVKDADELALLRRAIAITDEAFEATRPYLRPEQTEREAAWQLEVALRERGAEAVSFPIIVAAGANAALPHARPGDEPLGSGRPIVIDMGARFAGYHADLTRTIVLGAADERFQKIYTLVLEAQQRAIAGLCPGKTTAAVDALARDHIAAAGYGENFGHGLGHGVGLDVHEGPSLRRRPAESSEEALPRLRAGNVVTVEPGIYIEGWGGVRIEDIVLLHSEGGEVLSQSPKE